MRLRPKSLVLAPLALALVCAAPARAVTIPPILVGSGGTIKHYTFTVQASASGASVNLNRTVGHSTERVLLNTIVPADEHYTTGKGGKVAFRANFGSHGSAHLSFTPTGRTHRLLPKGCTGKKTSGRAGVLKGKLTAKLGGRVLRTIVRRRLAGDLVTPGAFTCGGFGGFGGQTTLTAQVLGGFGKVGASFTKFPHGRVFESAGLNAVGPHFSLDDDITASAPRSYFTATSKFATLKARGLGPFLGGTLKLKARGPAPVGTNGRNEVVSGGNFFVKMVVFGTKHLPKGRTGTAGI